MAVPCPRCRCEYDVTLFSFGRTIWSACDAGIEDAEPIRRVVDELLAEI